MAHYTGHVTPRAKRDTSTANSPRPLGVDAGKEKKAITKPSHEQPPESSP